MEIHTCLATYTWGPIWWICSLSLSLGPLIARKKVICSFWQNYGENNNILLLKKSIRIAVEKWFLTRKYKLFLSLCYCFGGMKLNHFPSFACKKEFDVYFSDFSVLWLLGGLLSRAMTYCVNARAIRVLTMRDCRKRRHFKHDCTGPIIHVSVFLQLSNVVKLLTILKIWR